MSPPRRPSKAAPPTPEPPDRRGQWVLAACVALVVVIVATAVWPMIRRHQEKQELAAVSLDHLGPTTAAAACRPATTKRASGSNEHEKPPTPITYDDAPPAFGPHWFTFPSGSEVRNFYTVEDRPEVQRLVHSLEHGHTVVWYDDTIVPGTAAYQDLEKIARAVPSSAYLMVVPWTAEDGDPFPDGAHVALTHWTGPKDQQGVWQYCDAPSGEATAAFLKAYPKSDTPEPGAP